MKGIISIEKGISTNNFIVKDVDYSQEKPYYLIHPLTLQGLGWKTLDEIRELNSNVEDYNMPFHVYRRFYNYNSISDFKQFSSLIDILENPTNYIKECEEIRNIIGLELEGADIEMNITRNEISEEKAPLKVFFDYFICLKYGNPDDWDSYNYSDFFVDLEKIKDLVKKEDLYKINEELYDVLVKTCRVFCLYFSKINK